MKVYCGKCVHYSSGISDRFYEYCNTPENKTDIVFETHVGVSNRRKTPKEKNSDNNCPHFKRGISNKWALSA